MHVQRSFIAVDYQNKSIPYTHIFKFRTHRVIIIYLFTSQSSLIYNQVYYRTHSDQYIDIVGGVPAAHVDVDLLCVEFKQGDVLSLHSGIDGVSEGLVVCDIREGLIKQDQRSTAHPLVTVVQ